jgi:hypothetical protein
MDDAEVEDSIKALVECLNSGYVSDRDLGATRVEQHTVLRAGDHLGVQIDTVDVGRAEWPENNFHSETLATANLKRALTVQATCHAKQERGLIEPLHHAASGVVEQHLFDNIQPHDALPDGPVLTAGVFG